MKKIALFISSLQKGGSERVMVNLAELEQLKKVLKFLSLSDIVVNDNAIEVLLDVK